MNPDDSFTEIIRPQPGPQTMLLSCEADIAISVSYTHLTLPTKA